MNFFEHQEQARQTSRRLVGLFVLAVVAIVIAVNAVVALMVVYWGASQSGAPVEPMLFFWVTVGVLALIGGGTAYRTLSLRQGGMAVARMVGARAVDPSTRDSLERRLLNIVEEMSLASGMAVPRVYVMDDESVINAFAAGHTANDAVIALTRGALTRLTRDELQGVVGHEFSHILNGDMGLNVRLLGVLHGLLVLALAGRLLLELGARTRGGGRSHNTGGALAVLLTLGAALVALGYLGVFFGRLIKASISRQREYLADAASVQFTRNPDGIGGALRKIGASVEPISPEAGAGSAIHNAHAEALSHMYMAPALRSLAQGWLATHPPLQERIRRIYGRTMPWLAASEWVMAQQGVSDQTPAAAAPEATAALSPVAGWVEAAPTPDHVVDDIGQVFALPLAHSPATPPQWAPLEAASTDSTRAPWVIFALLIDKTHAVRAQQRQLLTEAFGQTATHTLDALRASVQPLAPGMRLPLVERAVPALRKLSAPERHRLLHLTHDLIAADGRITFNEFLLYTVLKHRIGPQAGHTVPVKYKKLAPLAQEMGLVLSLLANVRLPDRPQHAYNAGLVLLPGIDVEHTDAAQINFDAIHVALDRLNELAPLLKPLFIKASAAVAFVDGATNWKAASCLRTVCAAIDAPLPPVVGQAVVV